MVTVEKSKAALNDGHTSALVERTISAVSWASVIGGAVAAVAIGAVLLELGAGLGLAVASPWPGSGFSATSFSIAGGTWLVFVQWIAAGIGGYLAGRLRAQWIGVHTDEAFFRDTAHGFLSWALATIIAALLIACVALAALGGATGATKRATNEGAMLPANSANEPAAYFADALFRSSGQAVTSEPAARDVRPEAGRILEMNLQSGDLSAADRAYLGQLVAERTGLSQPDAERRVDEVVGQMKAAEAGARDAADKARKTAAAAAIITALAMLIGAFIAAAAATLGGHERGEY